MTRRVCGESGCPTIIDAGTRGGRCAECERRHDRARGTRQERGYDAEYDAIGRDYQRRMDHGEQFACWRCGCALGPRRGTDWVAGHCDIDRRVIHGPECPSCNYATAGRTGCPHVSHV